MKHVMFLIAGLGLLLIGVVIIWFPEKLGGWSATPRSDIIGIFSMIWGIGEILMALNARHAPRGP